MILIWWPPASCFWCQRRPLKRSKRTRKRKVSSFRTKHQVQISFWKFFFSVETSRSDYSEKENRVCQQCLGSEAKERGGPWIQPHSFMECLTIVKRPQIPRGNSVALINECVDEILWRWQCKWEPLNSTCLSCGAVHLTDLAFGSVDEILKCDYSHESYWTVLARGAVYFSDLAFGPVGKIPKCDHSNESFCSTFLGVWCDNKSETSKEVLF